MITLLIGPPQTGKTTIAKQFLPQACMISFFHATKRMIDVAMRDYESLIIEDATVNDDVERWTFDAIRDDHTKYHCNIIITAQEDIYPDDDLRSGVMKVYLALKNDWEELYQS